jgi:hypothetical protein
MGLPLPDLEDVVMVGWMDPIGLGISTGVTVAKVVSTWLKGKASANELHQLTVRYWGCVLFELRANLAALETAVVGRRAGRHSVPFLQFTFADALLPELARMSPLPNVLSEVATIICVQRSIQRHIDLAEHADAQHRGRGASFQAFDPTATWVASVSERMPDQIRVYNQLRDAMSDQGRQAFADEWQVVESVILPDPLPKP